jgi:hypothetical protein
MLYQLSYAREASSVAIFRGIDLRPRGRKGACPRVCSKSDERPRRALRVLCGRRTAYPPRPSAYRHRSFRSRRSCCLSRSESCSGSMSARNASAHGARDERGLEVDGAVPVLGFQALELRGLTLHPAVELGGDGDRRSVEVDSPAAAEALGEPHAREGEERHEIPHPGRVRLYPRNSSRALGVPLRPGLPVVRQEARVTAAH